jgi:hypothetical protein
VCIGQQRSIFGADAPGNGHHLFHFRFDHRHVARVERQTALAVADNVVAVDEFLLFCSSTS